MFRTKRVRELEDQLEKLETRCKRMKRGLNQVSDRLRYQEARTEKVSVKVVDEDGEPVYRQNYHGRTPQQKYTNMEVAHVIHHMAKHLGLDLSVVERQPELLQISEEVVEMVFE